MHRRSFMGKLGALGTGAMVGRLSLLGPQASAATGDYKALVCVFLFGGNDGNNTLVPIDTAGYANYAAIRGGIALPQSQLVPLTESSGNASYGLHPGLGDWQQLWSVGQLGILLNVGTLVQPLTQSEYLSADTVKPEALFSHIDQQDQWQAAISTAPSRTGWGGRLAEQLSGLNASMSLPALISPAGPNLFVTGSSTSALTVPVSGGFGLQGFDSSGASAARLAALNQVLGLDRDSDLVAAAGDISASGIANSAILGPILSATSSNSATAFAGLTSGIALQLLAVSKLIEARASLGQSRQIFMVSLGSFDTHTNELVQQAGLLGQLGPALLAFRNALVANGAIDQVTTFTLSDFSRTLQPNTGGGTDHAWGNHHFVMGGAVNGGAYYGTYPVQALGGPSDAGTRGQWIPTIAVDQYAATLASWFGANPTQLATVLPNLASFSTTNLGFMQAA